jgi:hypothetical protein
MQGPKMHKPSNVSCAIALVPTVAIAALSLPAPGHAQIPTAEQRALMQTCRADARKLCADVKPGGGRVVACLSENKASLSPDCQAQIGRVETCPAEVRKLCPDAGGETELRKCASEKRDTLSAACRAATGG